eukprot:12922280-Prorocentrum_lima.AAC.1
MQEARFKLQVCFVLRDGLSLQLLRVRAAVAQPSSCRMRLLPAWIPLTQLKQEQLSLCSISGVHIGKGYMARLVRTKMREA